MLSDETRRLAAEIRSSRSVSDQVASLADRYRGRTCALVTCGPSLQAVDALELQLSLRGVPTIAVKQAISAVGEQADFHCWNSYNVSRYRWASRDTIRCSIASPDVHVPQWNRSDLTFAQVRGNGDLGTSLARSLEFDRYLLSESVVRPFGPGIMYELVIYLAVHIGCSHLVTFGWDIADQAGRNTHFDDSVREREFFDKGRRRPGDPRTRSWRDVVPEPVRGAGRVVRSRVAHTRGVRYNLTSSLVGESELVAESTVAMQRWLSSRGVELTVVTNSTHLRGAVRRLSVAEALAELRRSAR